MLTSQPFGGIYAPISSAAVGRPLRRDGEASESYGMVGDSSALKRVMEQVRMVAPTDSTVLIEGETGTGKELIARAVHRISSRRQGPFVTLNCAAIPASLLESELFGHERGAFTGAVTPRMGRFEMAHGGTLFLDEIGEMAPELQSKLLRVLQEREFERLGSSRTTSTNVRVVAATNRDLAQMAERGTFRPDLYYRLSVFPVLLPPLRDRREDIPGLARHFLAYFAEKMNKMVELIDSETIEAMRSYDWPGNIRELQNYMERGVILSTGFAFEAPLTARRMNRTESTPGRMTLRDVTRKHILHALEQTKWVIGGREGTAAYLGIPRTTLISKMRHLGIESNRSKMYGQSEAGDGLTASAASA